MVVHIPLPGSQQLSNEQGVIFLKMISAEFCLDALQFIFKNANLQPLQNVEVNIRACVFRQERVENQQRCALQSTLSVKKHASAFVIRLTDGSSRTHAQ